MSSMKLSGSRVKEARTAKNMSRSEVASAARTSIDTIKRAESGANDPGASTLARIAAALEVPIDSLFDQEPAS